MRSPCCSATEPSRLSKAFAERTGGTPTSTVRAVGWLRRAMVETRRRSSRSQTSRGVRRTASFSPTSTTTVS
jgi:hypothetical protein